MYISSKERLAQLAPDHICAALKQNINLKIEVQQRGLEIEYKLERLQRGSKLTREHGVDIRAQTHDRDLVAWLRERG